ncbi:A/G-specific adenine glycosylase [Litorivicinus lipolyticus]|uniref:Adenine DNA glycosylase n=1 Tax=Litorivicinus lipolyticus TaxID=418701 RepID=A0A5Q2QDL6_9GAMM|nr:A/G-specific adenine glycosylase [Litorivicinus lipolyticus]QGG81234.1 A/G-specific adenine glycosylase [Litorivicinus lipolyticus]
MNDFASRTLAWFDQHGRHDLPWQHRGPYVTWVSEIMLQQTQVTTAIPYFERFMARFPDIQALGTAPLDEVLAHWSGLGYYARARNLHKSAALLAADGVDLPASLDELVALPGIGRSTAGAILAMGHRTHGVILDGNVKRVLARHSGEDEWPGTTPAQKRLWALAHDHTPADRSGDFAQAMMDLGATLCTRSRPACERCPLAEDCQARRLDMTATVPRPKPKKVAPTKTRFWLIWQDAKQRLYLERRPDSGLWGGLYCPPEADTLDELMRANEHLFAPSATREFHELATIEHSFSHYHLKARPILVRASAAPTVRDTPSAWVWPQSSVATPAPVTRLIQQLIEEPT